MRGQSKIVKSLIISGRVFLDIRDSEEISSAQKGDIYLFLVLELQQYDAEKIYETKGYRGYFKAKIFDGYKWCHIDNNELFENKENHFSKSEISLYTFELCKQLLVQKKDIELFRGYREHYSLFLPEREGYRGRKDQIHKKK